jgi:hypothetical protein
MKAQQCRWLERDRHPAKPLRGNPKRTECSNQTIQHVEIRRTPPRPINDQQLVFGQNGFRDDGSHTAWLKYAHHRTHEMDKEEYQITHTRFYQRSKPFYFNVIWNSPGTGHFCDDDCFLW